MDTKQPDLPARLGFPDTLPTRSGYAYSQLREWIVTGELTPGRKLDQEWLASTLKVSRTPLRQALMRLQSEGLVEHRPYTGAIVAHLSLKDLEDIYATRGAIEAMLAYEATARRSKDGAADSSEAEQLLAAQEAGLEGASFVDLDRRFHLAIYSLTGFRTALGFLDRLFDQSERYARVYAQHVNGLRRSVVEHRKIYEAFRDGRAVEAQQLTAQHIEHGLATLTEVVAGSLESEVESPTGTGPG